MEKTFDKLLKFFNNDPFDYFRYVSEMYNESIIDRLLKILVGVLYPIYAIIQCAGLLIIVFGFFTIMLSVLILIIPSLFYWLFTGKNLYTTIINRFNPMTTHEQAAYNNDKMIKRKRKVKPVLPIKRTDYMRNCVFWIDEFNEGRTTQEEALKSIHQLKIYIQEIETELEVSVKNNFT